MTDTERLARYDALYSDLLLQREKLATRMEELKLAGKCKTVTYHQFLVEKLKTQEFIGKFEVFGLESPETFKRELES